MKNKNALALGLMSGTSADGLTLCLFDVSVKKVIHFKNYTYPKNLQTKILDAFNFKTPKLAELNFELGHIYAKLTLKFIKEFKINKKDISVIGSHGQTVFHNPCAKTPNTLQIGEAAFIAQALKLPVVSNFRARDMAAGGTGAPLIPAFDDFLFKTGGPKMLLNIGGLSNIALVGKKIKTFGFDVGPGNVMIDAAVTILTKGKKTYDKAGALAAKHAPDIKKAQSLLKLFIAKKPPVSLERSTYAEGFINQYFKDIKVEDIATITYLTALIVAKSIEKFILNKYRAESLIVSGGGVYNKTLLKNMEELLPGVKILSLNDLGIDPMAKEAACFAWLAWQTLHRKPSNCPAATGAKERVVLGAIINEY